MQSVKLPIPFPVPIPVRACFRKLFYWRFCISVAGSVVVITSFLAKGSHFCRLTSIWTKIFSIWKFYIFALLIILFLIQMGCCMAKDSLVFGCPLLLSYWHFSKGSFKRKVSRDFCFRFFKKIFFPQAPEIKLGYWRQILLPVPLMLLKLVAICHRYQRHWRKICHRCQRHQWQTMGTISDCWLLKVNLKEKIYLYANSTTQKCPTEIEIMKIFPTEDFFQWCTLNCEYLCEFLKKF